MIHALVADARGACSLDREAFAQSLQGLPTDPRLVMLRTCHRVELYAVGAAVPAAALESLPAGGAYLEGDAAVRHLVRVACGLESAVFGETEILHQLREAIDERRGRAALDASLDRLFQVALRSGREARTHLTGPRRSLSDVAVERILDARGVGEVGSQPHAILVVGAGRMGRLAARSAASRGLRVVVANRTLARGEKLAREVGGVAGPFGTDGSIGEIGEIAGVVVAIAGRWPVGPIDLDVLRSSRAIVVDLSSPPALDAAAAAGLGHGYVSVDEVGLAERAAPPATLARLEQVVSKAVDGYREWALARHAAPVITALSSRAEAHRAAELARLRRRLPDLDDDQLAVVDQMSHRLVAAMLHEPLSTLGGAPELEPAARRLFGL